MAVIAGAATSALALLAVWWCIFHLNREQIDQETYYTFHDVDSVRMWQEIQAAMNRPTSEGDR